MADHALLSPSAAKRWLHCTPAPRLEASLPDSVTSFAQEGTLAHAYCAKKLKTFLNLPTEGEDAEIHALRDTYHTGEMDEYTDTYQTIVLEKFNEARRRTPDARLFIETRLDFSRYAPDSFGTADALIIADGLMEIIDFKYGKGVRVSATDNEQMRIYALGAYDAYSLEYDIRQVRMTIVQPRLDNLSEQTIPVPELLAWADNVLIPQAAKAYKGEGEQSPGEWCRFCKVKPQCRALAEQVAEAAKTEAKLLPPDELAETYLPLLPVVKIWLASVEEHALSLALAGTELPGWKIVEGRSNRKITDTQAAAQALSEAGYAQSDIYKPQELRTITDLERLTGKKRFAEIAGAFIQKPQGKPTLAPLTDKREAVNAAAFDFKDIDLSHD